MSETRINLRNEMRNVLEIRRLRIKQQRDQLAAQVTMMTQLTADLATLDDQIAAIDEMLTENDNEKAALIAARISESSPA